MTAWAGRFHDDSSPASVTDVLVAFAFIAGLRFAASGPAATDALLRRMEEEMPAVGEHARLLASTLLDSGPDRHERTKALTPAPVDTRPAQAHNRGGWTA